MDSNNQNTPGSTIVKGSAQDLRRKKLMRAKKIVSKIRSVVEGLDSTRLSFRNACDEFGAKNLIQNYSNFKRSGAPLRFMYYMNQTWVGFGKEVFDLLKEGFLAQKMILEVSLDGSKSLFDFLRMLQVDMSNGNVRSISWIDVNKKAFFPNSPVDGEANVGCHGGLVVEVTLGENALKRKRDEPEDPESDSESSCNDSSEKSSCSVVQSVPKKPHLEHAWDNVVVLSEGNQCYKDIKNVFLAGLNKFGHRINVTSVRRCVYNRNPLADARHKAFYKQDEATKAARGGVSNQKLAWYGSSSDGVADVLSCGFGMTSMNNGDHPYGYGVYLMPARCSDTSTLLLSESDHNGERHALLCRVILGNVEKVNRGSDQFHPSSEQFDIGADDVDNAKMYIVWSTRMNRHILPEYVVSYKVLGNLQEVTSGRTAVVQPLRPGNFVPFVEMFEELKSTVPAARYRELENAYKTFKEGKIGKHTLIMFLRSIAGDIPIISAINKLRGFRAVGKPKP